MLMVTALKVVSKMAKRVDSGDKSISNSKDQEILKIYRSQQHCQKLARMVVSMKDSGSEI